MAHSPTPYEVKHDKRVIKVCPQCESTVFQGPFIRGPIVNGEHQSHETWYQCMGCNAVRMLEQLNERELPTTDD